MTRKKARKRARKLNTKRYPTLIAEVVEDIIMGDYYVQVFDGIGDRKVWEW